MKFGTIVRSILAFGFVFVLTRTIGMPVWLAGPWALGGGLMIADPITKPSNGWGLVWRIARPAFRLGVWGLSVYALFDAGFVVGFIIFLGAIFLPRWIMPTDQTNGNGSNDDDATQPQPQRGRWSSCGALILAALGGGMIVIVLGTLAILQAAGGIDVRLVGIGDLQSIGRGIIVVGGVVALGAAVIVTIWWARTNAFQLGRRGNRPTPAPEPNGDGNGDDENATS